MLQERDGVSSLIRVIDRITVTAVAQNIGAVEVPPTLIAFNLFISIKSGLYKGSAPLKLTLRSPDEEPIVEFAIDILLEGDDRGVNVVSPVQFQTQTEGLFWIDVSLLNDLITRVPLRVVIQKLTQGSLPWPPNPE